jgi:hypothetical protein
MSIALCKSSLDDGVDEKDEVDKEITVGANPILITAWLHVQDGCHAAV